MQTSQISNLLTDQAYILSDTAMISLDIYTQLISLSHTLGSFVRKVMLIIKYVMMKCKVIDERMKKMGALITKQTLER